MSEFVPHDADARAGDADALRAAAAVLEAVWQFDELRGTPHMLIPLAPRLRALADKIDPPMSDPDD